MDTHKLHDAYEGQKFPDLMKRSFWIYHKSRPHIQTLSQINRFSDFRIITESFVMEQYPFKSRAFQIRKIILRIQSHQICDQSQRRGFEETDICRHYSFIL